MNDGKLNNLHVLYSQMILQLFGVFIGYIIHGLL